MSYCPDSSPSAPAVRLREFLSLQYLVSTRVACASHSRSCPAANTSTKAKYFGALGAGLPSGINNRAITSTGISWSWNPSIPATSLEWRRAGTRRLFSRVAASAGALVFLFMNMPSTLTSPNPISCSRPGANYCTAPSLFETVVILHYFELFIIFLIEM